MTKKQKRNLAEWCRGELQRSIEEISERRSGILITINPAYTSQMDHRNGTLLGFRKGDSFFTFDGEVIQADYNASLCILARRNDPEISLYTKWEIVHSILLKRTASFLLEMGLTLQDAVDKGFLDPKHLVKQSQKKGKGKSRSQVA